MYFYIYFYPKTSTLVSWVTCIYYCTIIYVFVYSDPVPPNLLFADVTPVTCILVHVSMFVALMSHCWLTWNCVLQPWRRNTTLWWRCVTWWPVCPGPCLLWCATFSHSSTSEWSNKEEGGGCERWRDKVGAGGGVSQRRCKERVGENRWRKEEGENRG